MGQLAYIRLRIAVWAGPIGLACRVCAGTGEGVEDEEPVVIARTGNGLVSPREGLLLAHLGD